MTDGIGVPNLRSLQRAAGDWLWGGGAGLAMRAGRGIFGVNFVTSLGIAALTGAVIRDQSRGETLAMMMGYHAFADIAPVQAAAPAPVLTEAEI